MVLKVIAWYTNPEWYQRGILWDTVHTTAGKHLRFPLLYIRSHTNPTRGAYVWVIFSQYNKKTALESRFFFEWHAWNMIGPIYEWKCTSNLHSLFHSWVSRGSTNFSTTRGSNRRGKSPPVPLSPRFWNFPPLLEILLEFGRNERSPFRHESMET